MLFQGPFWVPFVCPQYSSHAFRHLDTPSQSPSLTCPVTIPSHPTLLPTSSTPRNTPHRLQLFQPHPPASNTDHPHLYQLQIQLCTHNTHLTAPDADLPPRPHAPTPITPPAALAAHIDFVKSRNRLTPAHSPQACIKHSPRATLTRLNHPRPLITCSPGPSFAPMPNCQKILTAR